MPRAHAVRRLMDMLAIPALKTIGGYAFFDGHTDFHVCKCYVLHKNLGQTLIYLAILPHRKTYNVTSKDEIGVMYR